MNGIIVEKREGYWFVSDVDTKQVVAVGNTIGNAVQNYEIIVANKEMEKSLGMSPDDFI